MTAKQRLSLPVEVFKLEELNLPAELAQTLAGQMVEVEVWPEELPGRAESAASGDSSGWIDPDGNTWADYQPVRVLYTDASGGQWRLPRRWTENPSTVNEPHIDSSYPVSQEIAFSENVHLPSLPDLLEVNIPFRFAWKIAGQPTVVAVRVVPHEPVKVFWCDSNGGIWRIPHNWRRRQIMLPGFQVLVPQGIPDHVAERFGNQIVSVNYHPGSLCCLKEQYRFRDEFGNRWPVYIHDCTILGFSDEAEHYS
jgi:hypothetical protein